MPVNALCVRNDMEESALLVFLLLLHRALMRVRGLEVYSLPRLESVIFAAK